MRKFIIVATVVMLAAVFAGPAAAGPDNLDSCQGGISGGEYANVTVEEGDWCSLVDVTVLGNVEVKEDARLDLYADTHVWGNVQAGPGSVFFGFNCIHTDCRGTVTIDGNFQQDYGWSASFGSTVIGGNVQIKGNDPTPHSPGVNMWSSTIGGNVQFDDNIGIKVYHNTIGGNCEAYGNTHPGFGYNQIAGSAEGQCAS